MTAERLPAPEKGLIKSKGTISFGMPKKPKKPADRSVIALDRPLFSKRAVIIKTAAR